MLNFLRQFDGASSARTAQAFEGALVATVPEVCLLDLDGDIVRQLKATRRARRPGSARHPRSAQLAEYVPATVRTRDSQLSSHATITAC
jgi:hypothetical protein